MNNRNLFEDIETLRSMRIIRKNIDIAVNTGYSEPVISNYLSKRVAPSRNFLEKFYAHYEKFLFKNDASYHQIENERIGSPIYDIEATAGDFEFSQNFPELIKGYINIPSFKECIAFLYVRGDSMYPRLQSGDLIGVIPVQDISIIQYGQVYLVVTVDNQRMIKYVRKAKDNKEVILRSENQHYDDIELLKDKILKLYMVKGPVRDNWQ